VGGLISVRVSLAAGNMKASLLLKFIASAFFTSCFVFTNPIKSVDDSDPFMVYHNGYASGKPHASKQARASNSSSSNYISHVLDSADLANLSTHAGRASGAF
jgi:hypothetical protein